MRDQTMAFRVGRVLGRFLGWVTEYGVIAAWWVARFVLLAAVFSLPYAAAAFVEWNEQAAAWSTVTRALVVVAWLAEAMLLVYVLLDDSTGNVRKAPR